MNSTSVNSPPPGAASDARILRDPHSGPWWKYPHMWMVIGGPLVVIVAGFITLYLAISMPDPVYTDTKRQVPSAAAIQPAEDLQGALTPAMQARNHAATGGVVRPVEGASASSAAPAR